ncbi:MAG: helix-hairpin-helix domain-containing protein [Saprospiraceae bacterium]
MKKQSAFFHFSRRERYGNTLLIALFLLSCIFPEYLPYFFPPPDLPHPDFRPALASLEERDTVPETASRPDTLFFFDPNQADMETFLRLGLSQRTARTIMNYREKGGRFRKKEDLASMYTITDAEYQRLEPYIRLPDHPPSNYKRTYSTEKAYKQYENVVVDINQATEEEWQQLRGIGPGYAGRIVRFRDKLGGFVSVEQVGETYGLPDSVFQQIRPQLAHSPILRFIHINTCTEEELAGHPFIQKRQARSLCLYRQHHGPFKDLEDLKKVRSLPDTVLQKLIPYLSFEEVP